ncbi:oocyte zinc finger protein XlCOF20 [Fundulus heteroclitus]|uniref:oocyte zinc finger protein XlCOF20 n=1 Tax=Fundulus heteroclitus TaxID=8078 RepID=UPI00165B4A57|nr:oocyte zinc finger protein XlCOF20 [Fundulus heteroclitus]
MSEMMKVEAEEPGLSFLSPISAASTSEPEQNQDSKDLNLHIVVVKEEHCGLWSSISSQQEPETPHIKEEEEELWIGQEEEQLNVKSEDEVNPQLSELHQIKTEDNRDTEAPTSSSADQKETHVEDCRGPELDGTPEPECSPQQSKMTVHKSGKRSKPSSKHKNQAGVHAGERPFGCSVCDKRFKCRIHVDFHMKTHTAKREHNCDFCGKGFQDDHSLQTHVRVHTGEKPFACDDCGKRFHAKNILNSHMQVHSEETFPCDVCGTTFKRKESLKKHMWTHTSQRPFVCSVCSKGFLKQDHLKGHMRVHTGREIIHL